MLSLDVRTCSTTKSEFDMEKSTKEFVEYDIEEKPHNTKWMKEIGAMNAAVNDESVHEGFEGIITITPTMWEKIKDFSLPKIFKMKDSEDEEHKEIYDAFLKTFYDFNPEKDVAEFLANPKIEPNTRTEKITLMLCYLYISCFAFANIEVWISNAKEKIDEVVEKLEEAELSEATSSELEELRNADLMDVWTEIQVGMPSGTDLLNYSQEIVAMLDKGKRGKEDVNELIDKFDQGMYYDWGEDPAENGGYSVNENLNFKKLMKLANTEPPNEPPKKRRSVSTKKSVKKQRRSQEEDEDEEDEDEEEEDEDEEEEDEDEEDEEEEDEDEEE